MPKRGWVEENHVNAVVKNGRNGLTCVFKREDHRLAFVAGCPSSFKCSAGQHSIAI